MEGRAILPKKFISGKMTSVQLVIYDVFRLLSIALSLYPEAGTVVIATTHDYFKARQGGNEA